MSQSAAMTLLREGIAAAQAGDKARTRLLLREATQLEPRNELAWLWMAGAAETAQDSVASLEKVLEINPSNTRARDGLKMARLQSGIAEARAGNKARARKYLLDVTQQDPRSEMAWMWLAGVAESPLDTVAHLQRVNPGPGLLVWPATRHRQPGGLARTGASPRATEHQAGGDSPNAGCGTHRFPYGCFGARAHLAVAALSGPAAPAVGRPVGARLVRVEERDACPAQC